MSKPQPQQPPQAALQRLKKIGVGLPETELSPAETALLHMFHALACTLVDQLPAARQCLAGHMSAAIDALANADNPQGARLMVQAAIDVELNTTCKA